MAEIARAEAASAAADDDGAAAARTADAPPPPPPANSGGGGDGVGVSFVRLQARHALFFFTRPFSGRRQIRS